MLYIHVQYIYNTFMLKVYASYRTAIVVQIQNVKFVLTANVNVQHSNCEVI